MFEKVAVAPAPSNLGFGAVGSIDCTSKIRFALGKKMPRMTWASVPTTSPCFWATGFGAGDCAPTVVTRHIDANATSGIRMLTPPLEKDRGTVEPPVEAATHVPRADAGLMRPWPKSGQFLQRWSATLTARREKFTARAEFFAGADFFGRLSLPRRQRDLR